MSYSPKSNPKMAKLDDKDLVHFIENGSLRHAAARYELKRRGLDHLASAADMKFLMAHEG